MSEAGIPCIGIGPGNEDFAHTADEHVPIRPGTDGALACAIMHVLFRDGLADWPYLERYTDAPRELHALFTPPG